MGLLALPAGELPQTEERQNRDHDNDQTDDV